MVNFEPLTLLLIFLIVLMVLLMDNLGNLVMHFWNFKDSTRLTADALKYEIRNLKDDIRTLEEQIKNLKGRDTKEIQTQEVKNDC